MEALVFQDADLNYPFIITKPTLYPSSQKALCPREPPFPFWSRRRSFQTWPGRLFTGGGGVAG